MPRFSAKERREHYTAVAAGEKPVKSGSKFSKKEQQAYARGQRDARNEQVVNYLLSDRSPLSSAEQQKIKDKRKAFSARMKEKRANKK